MLRDESYLLDMRLACSKVMLFTDGVTYEQFAADTMMQFAVVHAVQIIGETGRQVSAEFRNRHPEIPWLAITTMRHRIVHEYMKVDIDIVWKVVRIHVPELMRLLAPLVPPDSPTSGPNPGMP